MKEKIIKELHFSVLLDGEFSEVIEIIIARINEGRVSNFIDYVSLGNVEADIYFPIDAKIIRDEKSTVILWTNRQTGERETLKINNKVILTAHFDACLKCER